MNFQELTCSMFNRRRSQPETIWQWKVIVIDEWQHGQ